MVVAMLQTLLGILRRELTNLETAAAAPAEGGGETGVMSVLAGKIRKRGVVTNDESAGADTKTPSTESGDKNEPNPTSDAPIKPKIEE
jgi:hypothetical protein